MVYKPTLHAEFARDTSLSNQMRRASVSIMSNITEGFQSRTQALYIDYLGRAKASAGELRAQTYISMDIGYLNKIEFSQVYELCDKFSRQIVRFMKYLVQQPKAIREEGIAYNV